MFKNVNIKDAKPLKYAPNQFLNEEQIIEKEREMEKDRKKYSQKSDSNMQYSLTETEAVLKRKIEQLQADNKHLINLNNLKNIKDGNIEIKTGTVDGVARKLMRVNNVKGDRTELTYKLILYFCNRFYYCQKSINMLQ